MSLPQLNYKKILFIILFFVATVLLAYGVIKVFFLGDAQPESAGSESDRGSAGGGLPSSGGRIPGEDVRAEPGRLPLNQRASRASLVADGGDTRVLPVNADRVLQPTPLQGGLDVAYYDPGDGHFYRLSSDGGNLTLLTDEEFFSVSSVAWSPRRDKAVLEFPDGANILYDFTKRTQLTLPREITEPVFSPDSAQLAYKIKSTDLRENWLVVSQSDGSGVKFIEPLGDKVDQVQVVFSPDSQVVGFYGRPTSVGSSQVIPLGQQGENFRSLEVAGLNFHGSYSPDGRRLIYDIISSAAGFRPQLFVTDGRPQTLGLNNFDLGLSTWVEKCVIAQDSRTLYCAVPRELIEGAGLAGDLGRESPDDFYRFI